MVAHALSEIAWIDTTYGMLTPREALLRAHEENFRLSFTRPAFEISAQFRFLLSINALVLRHQFSDEGWRFADEVEELIWSGLSQGAVDAAIADLEDAVNLFDKNQPFMQRVVLPPAGKKDSARRLGTGQQEVKKLSPAMPSDQGEDYWNFIVEYPTRLGLAEATLKLVTHHYFSLAGNNHYDGDKTRMGAPGIRFLGRGYAATEFFWDFDEGGLLRSLLTALPQNWVSGTGLPAWADREAVKSRQGLDFHPLWKATWSSNTAACHWENEELTGVRICGVPQHWLPLEITSKWRKCGSVIDQPRAGLLGTSSCSAW